MGVGGVVVAGGVEVRGGRNQKGRVGDQFGSMLKFAWDIYKN